MMNLRSALLLFGFLWAMRLAVMAADEDPIPPALKPLLPKIAQGMSRDEMRKVLVHAYPKLQGKFDGPWSGQSGSLGFRLDDRYAVTFSAIVDRRDHEVVSDDPDVTIFDFVREIRYDLRPTGGGHYEIKSFHWGEASRKGGFKK